MFPAVNDYFFLPNYGTIIAAINFDRSGTTRIGRFVLNHSFMLPSMIATQVALGGRKPAVSSGSPQLHLRGCSGRPRTVCSTTGKPDQPARCRRASRRTSS